MLTSDIACEEQLLRGAVAQLNTARTKGSGIVEAYAYFARTRSRLSRLRSLPYDKKADEVFGTFPEYARKGKMSQDGRMAAIAIVNDMIVVTENIQHFARIPGVRYTDWTAETPEVMTGVADTPAPTQQQKRQQRREERRQGRRP